MIGKFVTAHLGQKLAGRQKGWKGALLGAAAPWLLRRAFTPFGAAAIGVYGAKKLWDRRQARRAVEAVPAAQI